VAFDFLYERARGRLADAAADEQIAARARPRALRRIGNRRIKWKW
jgi:hypothetical protein